MLRSRYRHDASLKQAGAKNSPSPVDAEDESVMEPPWPVRFRHTGQYCSHSKIRIAKIRVRVRFLMAPSIVRPAKRSRPGAIFTSYGGGVPGEKSVAVCTDTNAHTGSSETDTPAPLLVVTAALDIT